MGIDFPIKKCFPIVKYINSDAQCLAGSRTCNQKEGESGKNVMSHKEAMAAASATRQKEKKKIARRLKREQQPVKKLSDDRTRPEQKDPQ